MLKSSLYDYSNACILVKGRITITGVENIDRPRQEDERNKGVLSKHCALFVNCKNKINNIV